MNRTKEGRMSVYRLVFVPALILLCAAALRGQGAKRPGTPPFAEQIVFLYYADLSVAEAFFGNALGLDKVMDEDWVKIYRTSGGASVGAVQEGRGFHKPAASKPVMISWVVDNIDPWYAKATAAGVKVLKTPQTSKAPPMRSFLIADPTGYTFEFLQWLRP
jgi:predicted enzyme related to lactoylglutathione lyase